VLTTVNTDLKITRRFSFIIERLSFMSDFIIRTLVLHRILTEALRKIFKGTMCISIMHLDLQMSLLIHCPDTTVPFQSWPTQFTLVTTNCIESG
jgi:hypothetical protein